MCVVCVRRRRGGGSGIIPCSHHMAQEWSYLMDEVSSVDKVNSDGRRYRRGLAREGLGHLDQSIVDFETALKSNPGDGGADVQRALVSCGLTAPCRVAKIPDSQSVCIHPCRTE
jgi:hypothetical protein